jgi:hypothetical protein
MSSHARKVADLRHTDRVAIIFQQAPDDAFVTLIGKANRSLCTVFFIRSHVSASGLHQRTQNNGARPAAFAYLGILRP